MEKLVLLSNDVNVEIKLFLDDNNDVDVLFKLLIDNNVEVEKLENVVLFTFKDGSIDYLGLKPNSIVFTNGYIQI